MPVGEDNRDLALASEALTNWLGHLHGALEHWREEERAAGPIAADDRWQDVLRWHATFELSFTQLAEHLEDVVDRFDAERAEEDSGESARVQGLMLRPLARQALHTLGADLGNHLLETHLSGLHGSAPQPEAERVPGAEGIYRVRAHGCRALYRMTEDGPLVLTITPPHWGKPTQALPAALREARAGGSG
jgi:hypothetical protein